MELKHRKSNRLSIYDYNSDGAYFLTVCTQNKEHLLSRIVLKETVVGTDVPDGPQANREICIELTEYGKIAEKYINQLNDFYDDISVNDYVIMPNHIHLMLVVGKSGPSRTSVPTELACVESKRLNLTKQHSIVSKFVSALKRFSNKESGKKLWQMRSYDHIIRDGKDYDLHVKYIYENPIKWYFHGEDHDEIILYE